MDERNRDFPFSPDEAIAWIKAKGLDSTSAEYAYHLRYLKHTGVVQFWLRDKMLEDYSRERRRSMADQSSMALQNRILKLKMRGF